MLALLPDHLQLYVFLAADESGSVLSALDLCQLERVGRQFYEPRAELLGDGTRASLSTADAQQTMTLVVRHSC